MKAEDLMVGDWVTFNDCEPNEIVPIKIAALGTSELYVHIDNDEVCDVIGYHELTGIPLTPEILEKNGFGWTGSGDSTGMLSTPWGFDGIRYNIYVGLKKKTIEVYSAHPKLRTDSWRKVNKVSLEVCGCFVHELQHALRLCGIDKEIVL